MASKPWSDPSISDATSISSVDYFLVVQGGASKRVTKEVLTEYITGNHYIAQLYCNSGDDSFSNIVVKNDIGNIVWTRVIDGGFAHFQGTLTGAFPNDKTVLLNKGSVVNPGAGLFLALHGGAVQSGGDGNNIELDVTTTGAPADIPYDTPILVHLVVFP